MGNRASILDVAELCGQAGIRARDAAGRAAAMSSAFHSLAAGGPDANRLFLSLTAEEQATISGWKLPTPVTVALQGGENG